MIAAPRTFACGHPLTPQNTCWGGKCRECKRARDRVYTNKHLYSERARKAALTRRIYYESQGREVPGPPRAGNYRRGAGLVLIGNGEGREAVQELVSARGCR